MPFARRSERDARLDLTQAECEASPRPGITDSVTLPDIRASDLMHPTQVASPFHRPGWLYEEKYDGWRMLASKRDRQVRLVSRADRDNTEVVSQQLVASVTASSGNYGLRRSIACRSSTRSTGF